VKIKKRLMKKLLFIGAMLTVLAACSGTPKNATNSEKKLGTLIIQGKEKNQIYSMILEAEDGDKTKKKVDFMIDKLIVNELKLNEAKIRNMCNDGIRYANWNANFKLTYKYSEIGSIRYDKKEKNITVFMSGTAENAYGVADNVYSIIRFDLKGKMLLDKDGLPDIM